MIFRILIDNSPDTDGMLECEHGLSVAFSTGGGRFLVDTGLSGAAMRNAARLGMDISLTDHLILSHGHNDHTGGLAEFLRLNGSARIHLSGAISGTSYRSIRSGVPHDISADRSALTAAAPRCKTYGSTACTEIFPGVEVMRCLCRRHPRPSGNRFLTQENGMGESPYTADDELSTVIRNGSGHIIISPCSHSGILNILETFLECHPGGHATAFIGGLHLPEGASSPQEAEMIADAVTDLYPNLRLLTGHCTGQTACSVMSRRLGDAFHVFRTGETLSL